MNNFDYVLMMVDEACKSHSSSYHVLCVADGYARYTLRANWLEGAPVVYITYDDVSKPLEIYKEVLDVNDTQAIQDLIAEWREIESSFGEGC